MPQFAAQVVQQRLPVVPGVMRHLAALGVEQQVQPLGGGGFGVLRPGRLPQLVHVALVAPVDPLLLITNLSVKTGNRDTTFLGSPWKVLTKYKFNGGSFAGGLTVEKDQGERFFCPGTVSPDFF